MIASFHIQDRLNDSANCAIHYTTPVAWLTSRRARVGMPDSSARPGTGVVMSFRLSRAGKRCRVGRGGPEGARHIVIRGGKSGLLPLRLPLALKGVDETVQPRLVQSQPPSHRIGEDAREGGGDRGLMRQCRSEGRSQRHDPSIPCFTVTEPAPTVIRTVGKSVAAARAPVYVSIVSSSRWRNAGSSPHRAIAVSASWRASWTSGAEKISRAGHHAGSPTLPADRLAVDGRAEPA